MPLIVIVKGTLLTGTLPGFNVVIEGGENTNILGGSPGVDDLGFPHPMVSRLTRRTPKYRINYLRQILRECRSQANNDTSLSLSEAAVKMKEFALAQDFAL
jgi:hypothetical protein